MLQLTYILELLPPTGTEENIMFANINAVKSNRKEIAAKLGEGYTKQGSPLR